VVALLPIAELDCSGGHGRRRCAALHSSLLLGQASKLPLASCSVSSQIRLSFVAKLVPSCSWNGPHDSPAETITSFSAPAGPDFQCYTSALGSIQLVELKRPWLRRAATRALLAYRASLAVLRSHCSARGFHVLLGIYLVIRDDMALVLAHERGSGLLVRSLPKNRYLRTRLHIARRFDTASEFHGRQKSARLPNTSRSKTLAATHSATRPGVPEGNHQSTHSRGFS